MYQITLPTSSLRLLVSEQHEELQGIKEGRSPGWRPGSDPMTLKEQRQYADWCLKVILSVVLSSLPDEALRQSIEACLLLRDQLWDPEYQRAFHEQEKARSSSLATTNEL